MTVLNTSGTILIMVAAISFETDMVIDVWFFFKKSEQNLFYKESCVVAQYHYGLHENEHHTNALIFIQIQNTSYFRSHFITVLCWKIIMKRKFFMNRI